MPIAASSQNELRRKFLSDAFHTLNQPLTGLHCGLEIALHKPRNEGEYRQRISDGLENAGVIMKMVRAVRELAEATDPGERCGTVCLSMIVAELQNQLEVLIQATQVTLAVSADDSSSLTVLADPAKLIAILGTLLAHELEAYEPGSVLNLAVERRAQTVVLKTSAKGNRKSRDENRCNDKISEIRRNAACCYLWTLGGDLDHTLAGLRITLPCVTE